MKKIIKYFAFAICAAAFAGCVKEELVFEHEKPAFDTVDGKILIEAIVPTSTTADDQIYICGPFNGGEAAIGNINWMLEKSTSIDQKWGIYLDPTTFASGKTLADGFWFYSAKERREITVQRNNAVHELDAATGERYNVYVARWESYYDAPAISLPVHDGTYRIYFISAAPWDPVNLYMYGDVNDLGAGWPGIEALGPIDLGGNNYKYFELTKDEASGLTEHLIFNGNGGKQQLPGDQEPVITFGGTNDFFYTITTDADGNFLCEAIADIEHPGVEPFIPANPTISIYVQNMTEWESLYAYSCNHASDPVEEAFGAWPGSAPVDTVNVDGETYARFEVPESFAGKPATLIFHDNNGTRAGGPAQVLEDGLKLALISSGFGPVSEPDAPHAVSFYVIDETGWDALSVYAWGDQEIFGGWPGIQPVETIEWQGVTYKRFEFLSTLLGCSENFIFNNNGGGSQLADIPVTLAEDMFFQINAEGGALIEKQEIPVNIYVNNMTGWDALTVYAWGDTELFGGWPGAQPVGKTVYNDVEYTIFQFGDSALGLTENLIFNNNGGGTQLPDLNVVMAEDMFINITAEGAVLIEKPAPINYIDMYVNDQSGWGDIAVYAWGDAEMFGGWPGKTPVETVTIEGKTYKKFHFSDEYLGLTEHLIFNNNGGGSQTPDCDVTVAADMFIDLTAEGAALGVDPRSSCTIYVKDNSGWDGLAIYGWQTDEPECFGGWPGAVPAGTVQMCGETWKMFKVGMAFKDKTYHIIFNNNGAGAQFDGPEVTFDKDHFFTITNSACEEVENPGYRVYVKDNTGWGTVAMYAWGDVELWGGWPGCVEAGTQTIDGVEYKYFPYSADMVGKTIHPIINNNNGGSQMDLDAITLAGDHFITVNL